MFDLLRNSRPHPMHPDNRHTRRIAICQKCIFDSNSTFLSTEQNAGMFSVLQKSKIPHSTYLNSSSAQNVHFSSSSADEQSLILSQLKGIQNHFISSDEQLQHCSNLTATVPECMCCRCIETRWPNSPFPLWHLCKHSDHWSPDKCHNRMTLLGIPMRQQYVHKVLELLWCAKEWTCESLFDSFNPNWITHIYKSFCMVEVFPFVRDDIPVPELNK